MRASMGAAAAALLTVVVAAQERTPPGAARQACTVAEDENYGYVPEKPIRVGGSPMYGAARQQRYLRALRGPNGEPLQFKRLGSRGTPLDETIMDAYEVTYRGLEKPVTLLLDWYHYDDPRAPRGFTCGGPFNLTTR